MIVVGIGYPTDDIVETLRFRHRDYTPTASEGGNEWMRGMFPTMAETFVSGGGPQFLSFVLDELDPWVVARFPADLHSRAIAGHSLGGLFVISTLFDCPDAFNGYIAGSPSLWWDDFVTFEDERRFASSHTGLRARLFMGVGSREESPQFPMVSNVLKLDAIFRERDYQGFQYAAEVFDDEMHLLVMPGLMSRGLRFIYQSMETPKAMK